MMSSIIILGDPHIGKSIALGKANIGSNLNSRVNDQINLLDWTLERADTHSSKHIIITGDVFEDPKPHPALITLFIAWLKKCQAYNIHVHIIRGNHDILRSGFIYNSPLDIISEVELDNVSVYKDIDTITIDTTAITFLPFRDRKSFSVNSNIEALSILKESLKYELASIPITYKKVLVGHLAIEGSIPIGDEIDDIANELFCPINMFNGYDKVWMGHVHKPQVMQKKNPFVAHIGSMDISNFGETDHKKHIVVLDTSSNDFVVENLPTRALKKIVISIPKDTDDTTEYVLNEIKKEKDFDKSIVRVEIALSVPELKSINKAVIEKYLNEQKVSNISGITETKKIAILKKKQTNTINTKMDVASAIKAYAGAHLDTSVKSNFIELAMKIYEQYKDEVKD